jgi:Domain of unknown function (DUF4252)
VTRTARCLGATMLAIAGALAAQGGGALQPGRIRLAFGGLAKRAAEVSEVALDGPMLQLGIRMLSAEEPDARARQVLERLKGVYVKSFRFRRAGEYSARDLEAVRRQLQAPGWAHIIGVHSRWDGRDVDVYVKSAANRTAGLAIIAAYPRELRVVNLVGPVDPAALSRLGGHFGIPRVDTHRRPGSGGSRTKGGSQR